MKTLSNSGLNAVLYIAFLACAFLYAVPAYAQTTAQNQLRATITQEIMSDPRSQTMSQAQIYSLVNALTAQAEEQGLTSTQLTYRPGVPVPGTAQSTLTPCSDVSCSLSRAFGLDGSLPLIPLALFVVAALFILIYGIMREMGHPHVRV